MEIIDLGKNSYEELIYAYMVNRMTVFPVKSCREWLKDCTNALEWCGSIDGFDELASTFEIRYLACVLIVRPSILKEIKAHTFC